jgi:hypothetical protein
LTTRKRSRRAGNRQTGRTGGWAVAIAVIALCLQLVAPVLQARAPVPSLETELARLIDPHALCIAAGSDQKAPAIPADEAPPAPHRQQHFASCCPWHGGLGPSVVVSVAVEPIVFAPTRIGFGAQAATIVAAHPPGARRARAPPRAA